MTTNQALDLLAALRARFENQKISAVQLEAYAEDLLDLDYGIAAQAVRKLISQEDFWPSVAKIRRAYAEVKLNAPSPSAGFQQALSTDVEKRHHLVRIARIRVGDQWDWREGRVTDLSFRFKQAYEDVLEEAIGEIIAFAPLNPTMAALPTSDKIALRQVGEPEQIEAADHGEVS